MSAPIIRGQCLTPLILYELLAINLAFSITNVDATLENISFALKQRGLPLTVHIRDGVAVWNQILDLLDLKDNSQA